MLATVERLRGVAGRVFVPGLRDCELGRYLSDVYAAEQELAELRLELIRELDCRDVPRCQGATRTSVWLADRLRISVPVAGAMGPVGRPVGGDGACGAGGVGGR